MGGQHIHGQGPGDDGYDEDGYDESQRAEILEATRDGPSDGTIITDLDPDTGEDDESENEDELEMVDGEVAEQDGDTDRRGAAADPRVVSHGMSSGSTSMADAERCPARCRGARTRSPSSAGRVRGSDTAFLGPW